MSKPEKYSHINFKPPSGARREAEYGLKLRREHGRGGTAVGIARARDLANGVELSPSTIRRMKAFFDRHASDEKAEGFRQGEKGFPSNGKIANLLWGGPSGYAFAKKVVAQMEAADAKAEGRALRPYGSTHGMKPRVIVVHGAPYSDKQKHVWSSVADNDVVFDYQKIVEAISGSNRNRQDLVSYCMDIRTAILRKSLKTPPQDGKVWVITTKVSDDLRRQLQDIPVEYVHIEASKSECLARLEKDDTRHPDDIEELRKVIEDYFSAEQRLAPATPGVERRFLGNFSQIEKADPSLLRVERRSDPQTGKPKTYIVGYAASFGRDSLLLGDFIERIEPSAFDIVKERVDGEGKPLETRCLYNHSPDHLLGRFPTTMRMTVDEKGLRYECLLPESRSDIAELIERGDLKGSSFSFVISDGGERWEIEDGKSIRVVTSIKSLLDCGPVVYPAYGDASVSVAKRSYEQFVSGSVAKTRSRSSTLPVAKARAAKVSAEMRQFLEQRNCGTGSGGFQKGNSCGGGGGGKSSDDADTGAYTAPGSGSAFAIGAGIGAVAGGAVLGPLGAAAGGLAGGLVGSGLGHSRTEAAFNKASKAIGVTLGAIDSFARAISAELSISVGSNGEIVGNSDSGMSVTIQKYDETEVGKKLAGTTAHISSATSMVGKAGAESVSLLAKTLAKEGKKLGVKTLAVEVPMTGDKSQDRRTLSSYGDAGFDMNIKSDDGSKVTVFKTYTRSSRRSAVPAALEARDCGRAEGGRFGSGNECQKDGQGGQQQQAGKPKRLTAAQEGQEIAEMALLPVKLLGEVFGGLAKAKDPVLAKEASELVKATAAEVTKAKSPEGVAGVLRGFEKQFTQWASERLDVMIAKQGLRKKAVASRDCGRAPGGKFGSGNKCQADGSKYAEVSQDGNATAEDLQKFVDAAREGQLARGGKDGGQSDDGSGVQTWSKGDDYPWTTKQVGTDEGYLQAQHPDGSKTSKHPFTGGDTKPAFKSLQDELKRRKSSRSSQVIEETLAFLRERAQQ